MQDCEGLDTSLLIFLWLLHPHLMFYFIMIHLALRYSIFQLRNNGEKKTTKKPKWKIPQLETARLSMKNATVSLFTAPVCHEQKTWTWKVPLFLTVIQFPLNSDSHPKMPTTMSGRNLIQNYSKPTGQESKPHICRLSPSPSNSIIVISAWT